ncbi:MAG: hypothetical protein NVS4B2_01980 [Chloroflexota bacterium]
MLYDLGRALMAGHDISALLKTVTRQVVDAFEANYCCIFVPDASGALVPAAQTVREPAQDGTARAAARSGCDQDGPHNVFERHPGGDDHNTIAEPLRAGEHVIGVMDIGARTSGRPFDANERRLATVFAAQAALALARAQGEHERLRLSLLEESDKLKSALLSAVSHDLRTPLASIKASATSLLLADGTWATTEGRELLETIDHESDRLNRLVGNLLDLSRIEAGVLRPALDWYSVGDILDGMAPRLPAILGSRRLQINVQDGIGLIRVDLLRIEELLINLMENAGRYTPADSPIELRVGADANGLSIAVVDHGPGIPGSHRHHIFEAFARGHGHTDRDLGIGLGLAICSGIATAHGGVLTVTDTPGGGATFVLALPPECMAPGDDASSTYPAPVQGAPALPVV